MTKIICITAGHSNVDSGAVAKDGTKEADLAVLKVIMINEYSVEQARIQREKKVEAGVYPKQMPRPLNQDLTKR